MKKKKKNKKKKKKKKKNRLFFFFLNRVMKSNITWYFSSFDATRMSDERLPKKIVFEKLQVGNQPCR